ENESMAYVKGNDGMKKFYLDFEYSPLVDSNGEVNGIMITVNDVTEKVEFRQKVEDAESRLRLALEATGMATWDINLLNSDVIYSPRFSEIFGYEPGVKLEHDEMRSRMHPSDLAEVVIPAFDEAMRTGIYFYECRLLLPDGSTRWIKTQGKVQYNEELVPVRMVGTAMDVTEQKIQESNAARLAAIVESSDDIIISKDLDGIITSWNEGAAKVFGYTQREMVGRSIEQLIPDDRKDEETTILRKIRDGERIEHFETRRLNRLGELLDVSLTISPIKNSKGAVVGISKIARDITLQKKAERKLIENEEKLQIIVEASEMGTWELNPNDSSMVYSPKYLRILGFSPKQTPSHDEIRNRIHPEDQHIREQAYREAYKTGELHYISRIKWEDDSVHWVEVRGRVFYDEAKTPVRLLGTLRDITDDRLYQNELERNEQKFRVLANSIPQLIWTADANGKMNYYNSSVFDLTGFNFHELMEDGWVNMLHPEERDEAMNRWMECIRTGEEYLMENRFYRYSDATYRWHLSRAVAQRNAAGEIDIWVGTSTEIHEQKIFAKELEKQVSERTKDLQQANYHLEQMNQELASFAYVSSHDLQEPLRKIQTFATRISEKEKLTEEAGEYFRRMQNAAKRMQLLIDDLLTYSRTNTAERIFEVTNVNELAEDVISDMEPQILEKNAVITVDPLPVASVIAFQFRQLFTNLISNSLKFSKPDVNPEIRISADVIAGQDIDHPAVNSNLNYHRFTVSDNGIGFDPMYKNRIFELFQRLHGRSEYQGTGIGLAICKKIVENHFGFMMADGEQNGGATFYIFVPVND
ncbi:MAG: PAS domain S-box protein, partial [Bacteroidota bacterium]